MAGSNEHGRALELIVRRTLCSYPIKKGISATESPRSKAREPIEAKYFKSLDSDMQDCFVSGAWAFAKWADSKGWFDNVSKMVVDRIPDNEAKEKDPTDIRLEITYKDGKYETKNISVKYEHDALCHPRLPSLAQQCGFEKGSKIDKEYRKSYEKIWNDFYKKVKALGKGITTTTYLKDNMPGFIAKHFWEPMQKNVKSFLETHANNPERAAAYFTYLVGDVDYYVWKRTKKAIEIKPFLGINRPASLKVTYPWEGKPDTFLIEFDNGWRIAERLHTASSRLLKKDGTVFMSEKEDPICINLNEVIMVEGYKK